MTDEQPRPGQRPPTYLYKFRSLKDAVQQERARQIIQQKMIYLNRPSDFNDPFDCLPTYVYEAPRYQKRARMRELIARKEPWASRKRRKEMIANAERHSPRQVAAAMTAAQKAIKEQVGIFSMSARCDHPLMWSHYADSHKGVCIQVRTDNKLKYSEFAFAFPVHYQAERPVINTAYPLDRSRSLQDAFLHKADFWSYEEEWRIVNQNGFGNRSFEPLDLTCVIVGAEAPAGTEALVQSWLEADKAPARIVRAKLHDQLFRVCVPGVAE